MYLNDREMNSAIENSRNEEMCGGPEPIGYSDRFSSVKPKKVPKELRMKTISKYSCPR